MASLQTAAQEGSLSAAEIGGGADQALVKGQVPSDSEPALATWTCAACTWQNADLIPLCDACEKPRGFLPPVQQGGAAEGNPMAAPVWTCEKCTFQNEGLSKVCAMCEDVDDDEDDSEQVPNAAQNVNKTEAQGGTGSGGVAGAEVAPKEDLTHPSWTCKLCTYENGAPTNTCAMCGQPDAQAGKDTSAPEQAPSDALPANKENQGGPDSASMQQDGGAKEPEAPQGVEGEQTQGQREEGQETPEDNKVAGTQEQKEHPEPVKWSCQICTFENQEPDVSCQICTSPKPPDEGTQSENTAVQSQNMCSMCGLIKPFGQPWKGGLCSSCRPVVEEQPMEIEDVVIPEDGPSRSAPEPGPCGMCEKVVSGVILQRISSCGHTICSLCLSTLMQRRMEDACPVSSASHGDVLALLKCWEPGCHHLVGSGCLSCSLPSPAFLALSNWLVTVVSGLYSSSKAAGKPSLKGRSDDQTGTTASAELEFVCKAEDCPSKACPQTCKAFPKGDSSSRLWAFCEACPQVTCHACGQLAGIAVDDEFRNHRFVCPLVQTFEVFHALVDLEEAFKANESDGKESQDEGDARSNKKQKTEQVENGKRRIVWAKGTGFGGAGDEYGESYGSPSYDDDEDDEDELVDYEEEEEQLVEQDEDFDEEFVEPPTEEAPQDEEMAVELAKELATQLTGEEISKKNIEAAVEAGQIPVFESSLVDGTPVLTQVSGPTVPQNPNPAEKAGAAINSGVLFSAIEVALAANAPASGLSPVTPSIVETPAKADTSPQAAPGFLPPEQHLNEASEILQAGEASAKLVPDLPKEDAGTKGPSTESAPMEVDASTANTAPPPAPFNPLHFPTPPPGHAGPFPSTLPNYPPGAFGHGASDKRKERKDKEEAREEKLRKREREADLNLTCAAAALAEALTGDEFMPPQPNAATAALLHASCARRILYSILHRCSLLDMSHQFEREQLYLTMMHLIKTLGSHGDLLPVLLCEEEDEQEKDSCQQEENGTERKPSKGLLNFAFSSISRAFAKKEKTPGAEEKADKAEPSNKQGIRANPGLKELKIVLEGGKSVLGALGDLNRQARIVQQGLKNGMVEGEGEADFGVGIVGLVLEVSDCYEQLSRRAAHWDSESNEASEEREALMAMELSAKEAETGALKEDETMQAANESGPDEIAQNVDADVIEPEEAHNENRMEEETVQESHENVEDPKKDSASADNPGAKTPLKERVRKGLMGMLISRKNSGKGKEETKSEQVAEEPKTPDTVRADAKGKGQEVSREAHIAAYKAALKPLQFQEVSLLGDDGEYEHNFRNEVGTSFGEQSGSGAHSAKRQLRMLREIAALATTLPLEWESSVHIRVDESRMDLLKALIIGPEDTPYSNGIWLFDVLLPPEYPERPPKVLFLTTGGGSVRFNPNLYNCGKVCLSLLGTWSGPSWKPGKSTLLQVLISLQSLVFVEEPYYNEPGYESRESSKASDAYNQDVRLNAMKHAILAPLKSPPRAFQDVVKQHFAYKKNDVAAQIDDWISRADKAHKDACTQVGAQIKEELQKLGE